MKRRIRLTEGDLHRIVRESVKRILREDDEPGWYGCKNVHMIWHGEWADPELEYNGMVVNYYDVEDWAYEACKEEGVDGDNDEAFGAWIRENEDRVCGFIYDIANPEQYD